MKLLIPDMSIENPRDDFIWCAPIQTRDWNELVRLSIQFKCISPNGMHYLHRIGKGRQRIIIIPWRVAGMSGDGLHQCAVGMSKEDIEQECAWLRLVKGVQHPIYVVPHGIELTTKEIIARSMCVSPHVIQSLDSLKEVNDDGNT